MSSAKPRVALLLALGAILSWSLALRLGFGLRDTHGRVDFDERFNLENVAKFVASGEWRPANGYYSLLSWAPQAAVAAGIQNLAESLSGRRPPLFEDGRPHRSTLYAFRAVQAIYGTLHVWVIFCLARALSGAAAGLLASALASSSWLYVWAGSWFKPDGLAALATALAVLWSIRAIRRPTLMRHLLAGVGIGLAVSAKMTAAVAALPLAIAAPFLARGDLRRWRDLVLSAFTAVATFFVTAPFWRLNLHYVDGVLASYARRAAASENTYPGVLAEIYGRLLTSLHGPLWTILFWFGAVALVVPAACRTVPIEKRLALRAVTATVLVSGPLLLFQARVPFMRPNNVFPVLPLVAVVASATAVELWRRSAAWRGRYEHPVLAWAAGTLLVAFPIVEGTHWLYSRAVPTTEDSALVSLRGKMTMYPGQTGARVVFLERQPPSDVEWDGHEWRGTAVSAFVEVGSLADLDEGRLDRADAEIFPVDRLRGDRSSFYARRMRLAPRADRVHPRFLRGRGPDLVVLLHPWREGSAQREPAPADSYDGSWQMPLPAALDGQLVSLVFRNRERRGPPAALRLEGAELPLHPPSLYIRRWNVVAISERFAVPANGVVEIDRRSGTGAAGRGHAADDVEILAWTRSSAASDG